MPVSSNSEHTQAELRGNFLILLAQLGCNKLSDVQKVIHFNYELQSLLNYQVDPADLEKVMSFQRQNRSYFALAILRVLRAPLTEKEKMIGSSAYILMDCHGKDTAARLKFQQVRHFLQNKSVNFRNFFLSAKQIYGEEFSKSPFQVDLSIAYHTSQRLAATGNGKLFVFAEEIYETFSLGERQKCVPTSTVPNVTENESNGNTSNAFSYTQSNTVRKLKTDHL